MVAGLLDPIRPGASHSCSQSGAPNFGTGHRMMVAAHMIVTADPPGSFSQFQSPNGRLRLRVLTFPQKSKRKKKSRSISKCSFRYHVRRRRLLQSSLYVNQAISVFRILFICVIYDREKTSWNSIAATRHISICLDSGNPAHFRSKWWQTTSVWQSQQPTDLYLRRLGIARNVLPYSFGMSAKENQRNKERFESEKNVTETW